MPPKVMCVRAVFFGQKRLPPFLADHCFGWFRGRIIPSFWWTLDRRVVHCRGSVRKVLCFGEKRLPPFLRTIVSRGLVFGFACLERWMPSPRRKTSPPFLACMFQFFRGCLCFVPSGVGVSLFRAIGFCFGYFERPKVFGVCLALVVSLFSPKVFGSDLLKGRNPLAFV